MGVWVYGCMGVWVNAWVHGVWTEVRRYGCMRVWWRVYGPRGLTSCHERRQVQRDEPSRNLAATLAQQRFKESKPGLGLGLGLELGQRQGQA